jgi:hypothetical protein
VALRKLVEAARRETEGPGRRRAARDAAYRFASVMAGDRPGFEDMSRALFAGDAEGFEARIADWPATSPATCGAWSRRRSRSQALQRFKSAIPIRRARVRIKERGAS